VLLSFAHRAARYRLPLYHEAKVVFVVYLWHPRFRGATSIYNTTVRPLLRKNEAFIDRKLAELFEKAGDIFSANKQR
jgi:receptor expression-enhancing protein 1/2/3/4